MGQVHRKVGEEMDFIRTHPSMTQCKGCEGLRSVGETFFEDGDDHYCEVCYEEKQIAERGESR